MKHISDIFPWIEMLIFWSVASCEDLSTKTCAELQVVHGGSTVKAIKVREENYVNITFELTTNKCQYKPDWFRVRVAPSQKGPRISICTIIFHGHTCNVTESSTTCQCLGQMYASMYMSVSQSETAFILEWTDATTMPKQQEKTILLDFSEDEERGSRTSVILGVCFAVLLAMVVIVAIIAFLWKYRDMRRQSRCKNSSTTYTNTREATHTRRFARSQAAASNRTPLHIGVPHHTRTALSSRVPTDNQATFVIPSTPNSQVPEESQEISHTVINAQIPVVVYIYDHLFSS